VGGSAFAFFLFSKKFQTKTTATQSDFSNKNTKLNLLLRQDE
jgi:hypothetical protein